MRKIRKFRKSFWYVAIIDDTISVGTHVFDDAISIEKNFFFIRWLINFSLSKTNLVTATYTSIICKLERIMNVIKYRYKITSYVLTV